MVGQSFPVVIGSTLSDYPSLINGIDLQITVNFVACEVVIVLLPELDDMEV